MTKPFTFRYFIVIAIMSLVGCAENKESTLKANDVIPIFEHFNLILGAGLFLKLQIRV